MNGIQLQSGILLEELLAQVVCLVLGFVLYS